MDNEIDFEDLESGLYGQIYHISSENEQKSSSRSSNINSLERRCSIFNMKHCRYFYNENNDPDQQIYIPFENIIMPLPTNDIHVYNTDTVFNCTDLTANDSFTKQLQNNSVPFTINSECKVLKPDCRKHTSLLYKTKDGISHKRIRKQQRMQISNERNKEKYEQIKECKHINRLICEEVCKTVNEILYISDESDGESIIVQNTQHIVFNCDEDKYVPTSLKNKEDSKYESDDDVIYIPTPPVEVISVDVGLEKLQVMNSVENIESSEVNSNSTEKQVLNTIVNSQYLVKYSERRYKEPSTLETTRSNDFLDNTNIDKNKFNFSLHGSDFNNTHADFIPSTNTVDFCETESSCSTNNFNKDCNNSIKSVVFDEIEFPREDAFLENNLESFGSYILPKRNLRNKSKNSFLKSTKTSIEDVDIVISSESTSESNYDPFELVKKGLGLQSNHTSNLSAFQPNQNISNKTCFLKETPLGFSQPDKSETTSDYEEHRIIHQLEEKSKQTILQENRNVEGSKWKFDNSIPLNQPVLEAVKTNERKMCAQDEVIKCSQDVMKKESKRNLSNLVLNDRTKCAKTHFFNSEVVTLSDPQYDFNKLKDVGKDLELINCTNKVFAEEVTVGKSVDDFTYQRLGTNNFDIDIIHSSQSDNPHFWRISPKDLVQPKDQSTLKYKKRCHKCRLFGHTAVKCGEKLEPRNCGLCGHTGHQQPKCPNKMCTQCGNKGDYSTTYCWKCFKFRNGICRLCNMQGHIAKTCPDLWRRYHLTTDKGPMVVLEEPQLKPRNEQWCSGCANQGHLEFECNYYNREYPPTNPCIINYEDVLYQDKSNNLSQRHCPLPIPGLFPRSVDLHNILSFPQNNSSSSVNIASTSQNKLSPQNNPLNLDRVYFNESTLTSEQSVMLDSTNYSVEVAKTSTAQTKVFNPFSIFATYDKNISSMESSTTDKIRLSLFQNVEGNTNVKSNTSREKTEFNQRSKHVIMSMPCRNIKQFLKKAIAGLKGLTIQNDPRYFKRKLLKYEKLSKNKRSLTTGILREKSFWNRKLNMYIFGIHKFGDGKMHLNYLKTFLAERKQILNRQTRRLLLSSYNYIFSDVRHAHVNYYKIIQHFVDMYKHNKCTESLM